MRGEIQQLKEAINTMVDQLRSFASEVTRVARAKMGTDGELGSKAIVPGVAGTWKDLTDNVNLLAANLTTQVRNIAEVTTAVARGDLSRKITVDVRGDAAVLREDRDGVTDLYLVFSAVFLSMTISFGPAVPSVCDMERAEVAVLDEREPERRRALALVQCLVLLVDDLREALDRPVRLRDAGATCAPAGSPNRRSDLARHRTSPSNCAFSRTAASVFA